MRVAVGTLLFGMSQLTLLRAASTLAEVATLLDFKPSALAFILYKKPPLTKYTTFTVPKRGGGIRTINAPSPELKLLQRRLSDLLQNCMEEINRKRNLRDGLAHGFKRNRSIISNAVKHKRRRYVFNIDLQDFFPTINRGRVRGFFIKDANFLLHEKVATVLAQIACTDEGLPQGAPCSPVISNLVGHILDIRLCKRASTGGCTYSRYADDITFSTNKPEFPRSIARRSEGDAHRWEVGDQLAEAVVSAGFTINPLKTRMQYKGSRQAVTGLVVNEKVNVRAEYRRIVRAMTNRLFGTGKYQRLRMVPNPQGVPMPIMVDGTMAQLHGMFGHINAVDIHNSESATKDESRKQQAKAALRSKEKLYRRFLMFKDFYAASVPVLVCEGKTDNVYLQCAIKSLAATYPKLATVLPNGRISLRVRILKTANTSTGRVLQLDGGASFLDAFIRAYCGELKKFRAPGMSSAAILIVDNDSGCESILATIRKRTNKKVERTDPFVHVAGNLYVALTPLNPPAKESKIEDCFAQNIQNLKLGGKTFSPDNKADSSKYFGKHILSEYVKDNAAKIDFGGFGELLNRITAVVEAHETKKAAAPAQSVP
jgi:RNA-directed DNA polymerase